jgi:hypothetical protein
LVESAQSLSQRHGAQAPVGKKTGTRCGADCRTRLRQEIQKSQKQHTQRRTGGIAGGAKGGAAYYGVSRTTFLEGVKAGRIPNGLLVSPRRRVWTYEDLDAALDKLAEAA